MKGFKRITAFVLTIVMLACSVSFAADPAATIVSPVANSISTSDSILVSVKLNQPGTVRVTVYEEKIKTVEVLTKAAVSGPAVSLNEPEAPAVTDSIASGNAVSEDNVASYAVAETSSGAALTEADIKEVRVSTYASVLYKSVDTTSFEAIDFVSNPALATYVDRVYINPVTYTSTENIGFYTQQISGVKPGLYKISVQVLDEEGKVTETTSSYIAVKEKPAAEEKVVFEQKQTGALKIIQNLLKTLFK